MRPASVVMSLARAGAAFPNALSFARILVRKMQRGRWRIETVRLELDADGRGEALYRITAGGRSFHFLALSNVFAADEKVDRSFGINWDVSAALCQGDWTAEREMALREEIPKQYAGRYEGDVLCFCRGNRSERIFEHVVGRLAAGRQPDPALLATVGYLLRSTAFAGNGLFGMRPYEGLGPAHPLGAPYDAQMLAAFMLREFVFDLVDALAASRGPAAIELDGRLKRYLGVGNSAGLGLIPFVASHPEIIHRWTSTHEAALAAAKSRLADAPRSIAAGFLALLDKAICYFRQENRDGNGIFASYERLATELSEVRVRAATWLAQPSAAVWADLLAWIEGHCHPEIVELVNGILIELFPDVVATHEGRLGAVESTDIRPEMTIAALREALGRSYGWLLTSGFRPPADVGFFWYYPAEAPDEPRRGRRGIAAGYEFESRMDLPLQLDRLAAALDTEPEAGMVASLLARRPDLRTITARVQAVDGLEYADLRDNFIAASFTPFTACRFVLSFYGMEKLDPRPPRSTKGALLQGAPIAAEIASGIAGEWPFPLFPDLGDQVADGTPPVLQPLRSVEAPETPVDRIKLLKAEKPAATAPGAGATLFPLELGRLVTKAALSAGYPLGTAEFVAGMAVTCASLGRCELDGILDLLETPLDRKGVRWPEGGEAMAAAGSPAFAIAPAALDWACAEASRTGHGNIRVIRPRASPLLLALVARAAKRGLAAVLLDDMRGEVLAAGPGRDPWLVQARSCPGLALALHAAPGSHWADMLSKKPVAEGFGLRCLQDDAAGSKAAALRQAMLSALDGGATWWLAGDLRAARTASHQAGFRLTDGQFRRLLSLAKRTLVPDAIERRIASA